MWVNEPKTVPTTMVQMHEAEVVSSVEMEGKKSPDLSLEWKDLKIEIKVYGKDVNDDDQEFLELFPQVSSSLLSSTCIQEKKEQKQQNRSGSRLGHTLTELLEQNQEVNSRKPDLLDDDEDDDDSKDNLKLEKNEKDKGVKQEDKYGISKLISLPNGQKKCHVCGKVFTDSSRVKRHLMSHSETKPYSCHLCGWGFYQKCNMDRHMTSHSKEGEGEPCPHCNNWFTTKSVLSLHMRDAHNDRLLTKKEVEVTMNRMRRQMEEQKKMAEFEEKQKRMQEKAALQQKQRHMQMQQMKVRQQQYLHQQQARVEAQRQQLQVQMAGGNLFETLHQQQLLHQQQQGLFPNPDAIARRMDRIANLTCKLCNKTFVKKTNLKHHMMLHRGEKPWKCNICEWRFVQKCNLKKHMDSHVTGAFSCPACDVKFSSKTSCSTHLFRAHRDQYPQQQLADSKIKEEEEQEISPPEGDKPATSVNNWWKQIEGKLDKPETSNLQAALSLPKKKAEAAQPLTCNKCGKMFLTKEHLNKHMMVHNSGVKPYACPVCGCRFHLIHNMKRHIHTHEEQGDIEVGTADGLIKAAEATSSQAGSVARPTPSGLLSKAGPTAGVSVDRKGNMKCNTCDKWFPNATLLGAHMVVHDKDKPHVCSICGWRFKQHQNLKRHMHTHTGIKPFTCDFCEKGYTDAYTLKMHISKSHPDVASSLPSLQISKPRPILQGEDDGFNSMLNEMQRKEAAVEAYQAQFVNSIHSVQPQDNYDDDSAKLEDNQDDSLVLEPDIDLLTPDEEMVVEEDIVDEMVIEEDIVDEMDESTDNIDIVDHVNEVAGEVDDSVVDDEDMDDGDDDDDGIDVDAVDEDEDESVDIRDILNMEEDEDEEIVEDISEVPNEEIPKEEGNMQKSAEIKGKKVNKLEELVEGQVPDQVEDQVEEAGEVDEDVDTENFEEEEDELIEGDEDLDEGGPEKIDEENPEKNAQVTEEESEDKEIVDEKLEKIVENPDSVGEKEEDNARTEDVPVSEKVDNIMEKSNDPENTDD